VRPLTFLTPLKSCDPAEHKAKKLSIGELPEILMLASKSIVVNPAKNALTQRLDHSFKIHVII
jgi:hypothetical protein